MERVIVSSIEAAAFLLPARRVHFRDISGAGSPVHRWIAPTREAIRQRAGGGCCGSGEDSQGSLMHQGIVLLCLLGSTASSGYWLKEMLPGSWLSGPGLSGSWVVHLQGTPGTASEKQAPDKQVPGKQASPPEGPTGAATGSGANAAGKMQPPAMATAPERLTDADRISRIKRSLEANKQRLSDLQRDIDSPSQEHVETEETFKKLDGTLQKRKTELSQLPEDKTAQREKLMEEIQKLELEIAPVRDRFNELLNDRRLRMEKVNNLKELIRLDQESLDQLMGNNSSSKEPKKENSKPTTTQLAPVKEAPAVPPAAGKEGMPAL
ncbi:MAG TPA: hypothetical protein PKA06_03725, partial [Gemmatales bacterium]|nr:hypothetical protein [Gemmatales bacterium]